MSFAAHVEKGAIRIEANRTEEADFLKEKRVFMINFLKKRKGEKGYKKRNFTT